jgi:UDP-glucose 4-epimerase
MKRVCITGGAGFIGSNLVDWLLSAGIEVVVVDNFKTGKRFFLSEAIQSRSFTLLEGDVLDTGLLAKAMVGCDWVFHLQANADVRYGLEHPTVDLEQNTISTSNVLEAMRQAGVKNIAFSSTGSVYGEPDVFPTPEICPFPTQTSLYGASKVACEGLISAYAIGFGFTACIFRFVSILGERYTHGHVIDFYRSLSRNKDEIEVLGDGKQTKSYLYVGDCLSAMTMAAEIHENSQGVHIYNLGVEDTITVDQSLAVITQEMNLKPHVHHSGGSRGWVGDSPLIHLDTTKIRSLGWAPRMTITDAIEKTVDWLKNNEDFVWNPHTQHASSSNPITSSETIS